MQNYTLAEFNEQFPDQRACLDYMFRQRWPNGGTCPDCGKKDCFYPVSERRSYSCSWCGHQLYPTAGTIFHKSSTSLKSWFFAIFLMSTSRNGVAAAEIERQVGVTYKTAWRMCHEIRKLMADGPSKLKGVVEADETYIGGKRKGKRGRGATGKTPVVGLVQRGGDVQAKVVPIVTTEHAFGNLARSVEKGSTIYTDEFPVYNYCKKFGFKHGVVNHGQKQYVLGPIHTNTIEGFWSQLKRSIDGTHHHVSGKHLQKYVDEFVFRYNRRLASPSMFSLMAERVGELKLSEAA
jgi:transposase